jgi:hypothetical protein
MAESTAPARQRFALEALLGLYLVASYSVYGTWLAITSLGVMGYLLHRRGLLYLMLNANKLRARVPA